MASDLPNEDFDNFDHMEWDQGRVAWEGTINLDEGQYRLRVVVNNGGSWVEERAYDSLGSESWGDLSRSYSKQFRDNLTSIALENTITTLMVWKVKHGG